MRTKLLLLGLCIILLVGCQERFNSEEDVCIEWSYKLNATYTKVHNQTVEEMKEKLDKFSDCRFEFDYKGRYWDKYDIKCPNECIDWIDNLMNIIPVYIQSD